MNTALGRSLGGCHSDTGRDGLRHGCLTSQLTHITWSHLHSETTLSTMLRIMVSEKTHTNIHTLVTCFVCSHMTCLYSHLILFYLKCVDLFILHVVCLQMSTRPHRQHVCLLCFQLDPWGTGYQHDKINICSSKVLIGRAFSTNTIIIPLIKEVFWCSLL